MMILRYKQVADNVSQYLQQHAQFPPIKPILACPPIKMVHFVRLANISFLNPRKDCPNKHLPSCACELKMMLQRPIIVRPRPVEIYHSVLHLRPKNDLTDCPREQDVKTTRCHYQAQSMTSMKGVSLAPESVNVDICRYECLCKSLRRITALAKPEEWFEVRLVHIETYVPLAHAHPDGQVLEIDELPCGSGASTIPAVDVLLLPQCVFTHLWVAVGVVMQPEPRYMA